MMELMKHKMMYNFQEAGANKNMHYFAVSWAGWATSTCLLEAINKCKKLTAEETYKTKEYDITLYFLPINIEEMYYIKWFQPQVEGALVIDNITINK